MPTIKDIAKLAGVSHGTVSNVINCRGNVSAVKIRLVQEAARKLGYSTNAQAQKLRREKNRHLAFIIPNIEQRTYQIFYTSLKANLENSGYTTSLYLTSDSPEYEKKYIQAALSDRPEYIVSFSYMEDPDAYSGGSKLIFINNPRIIPRENQTSVFFDFESAGADFAARIAAENYRSAAFLADSGSLPASRVFLDALHTKLAPQKVEILSYYYNSLQIHNSVISILGREPQVDVIITDPLGAGKIKQIRELLGFQLPPLICLGIRETFRFYDWPYYEFDYRDMAQRVFTMITENFQAGERVSLKAGGFAIPRPGAPASASKKEITLLTGTTPIAKILPSLAPLFKRSTGIELKLAILPYEDLFFLLSSGKTDHYDLIRIDMAWGVRFEKELFVPLDTRTSAISGMTSSFLPSIKNAYCSSAGGLHSIPFDPSIQMLFYRRDLFEDNTLKRLYYEKTGAQLEVPKTFSEYNRIAAFFTAKLNPASPVQFGTTMSYGQATAAACDILPRIKSLGADFFDSAGRIAVHTPLFKKALDEYLEMKDYSGVDINYWWEDTLRVFSSGLAAMTILFINRAGGLFRTNSSLQSGMVGVAPVPGNRPLLGGGSIGISRQSRNPQGAIEFLDWLYSDEIANIITLLGGLSPSVSVFSNEEILEIYPWLRNIDRYFSSGFRRTGSKKYLHFDNYHFERIFGGMVRSAAMGLLSPEDALKSAQRQCEEAFDQPPARNRG
jgi:multiple sugar transport system substrate-binding protein